MVATCEDLESELERRAVEAAGRSDDRHAVTRVYGGGGSECGAGHAVGLGTLVYTAPIIAGLGLPDASAAARRRRAASGTGNMSHRERLRPYIGSVCIGVSMVGFIVWLLLLVICWPLALLALVLLPVVWLLLLPFRLLGIAVGGAFALVRALVFLPARLLGERG